MRHTKGPWHYDSAFTEVRSNDTVAEYDILAFLNNGLGNEEEAHANGRLMAAAPLLLEACRAGIDLLTERLDMSDEGRDLYITLSHAIVKATIK